MQTDIKKEFLEDLKALLEKYNATIYPTTSDNLHASVGPDSTLVILPCYLTAGSIK